MYNLTHACAPHDFWVWADMQEPLVLDGLMRSGGFLSVADPHERVAALPFVENPGFIGQLSPFGLNVVRDYAAEYRLELRRLACFRRYPSRLGAIFLFLAREDAWRYAQTYPYRAVGRRLLRLRSCPEARWSVHDSAWIDVLRQAQPGQADLNAMADAYWRGDPVAHSPGAPGQRPPVSESPPQAWHGGGPGPIREVLFLGRVAVQADEGTFGTALEPHRMPAEDLRRHRPGRRSVHG